MLIDLHAHVFPYGSAIGIPADELVPFQATTTLVSAGDAGANNIAAFRRAVVPQTRSRLYAFVHIVFLGRILVARHFTLRQRARELELFQKDWTRPSDNAAKPL